MVFVDMICFPFGCGVKRAPKTLAGHPTKAMRGWRIKGNNGHESMKTIDITEFQSAKKTACRSQLPG
jgi:hypothetical protein